jgi:hypothetical protein
MIFGNWRPAGLLAGSALFGYTETLGLRQGGTSVRAPAAGAGRAARGARGLAVAALPVRGGGIAVVVAILVGGSTSPSTPSPATSPDDALRRHAAGARARLATAADAGGRRADLPQGSVG